MKALLLVVALLGFGIVANAQTSTQAEVFVRGVYAQYKLKDATKVPDFTRDIAPSVFSPSLTRLIRKDQHDTPKGYVGKLDFDPICSCQDSDGLELKKLTIRVIGEKNAVVDVTLRYPQPTEVQLQLYLVWTPAGWRINNSKQKNQT